jgi:leader peptidase (prepilin peptidase)/N-methyltransferase
VYFWIWIGAAVLIAGVAAATLAPRDILFAVPFSAITLWLTYTDLQRFELPDLGNLALFVLGLAWVAVLGSTPAADLLDAVARAAVAAGFFILIRIVYRQLRNIEGLGLGDVKLAAAGAVWLTWEEMPTALLIAAVAAVIATTLQAARNRQLPEGRAAIPLGAFLAPAIWLVWYGDRIGWV